VRGGETSSSKAVSLSEFTVPSPYQWLRSLLEQVSLSTSLTHMYRSGAVLPSTGRGQERIMKKVPAFESFCGCAGMGSSLTTEFRFREPLIKSKNKLSCHSGESRKPVKTIVYWMPFFNGMTTKTLIQSFLSCKPAMVCTLMAYCVRPLRSRRIGHRHEGKRN
jgi:hypothetical protein